LTFAWISLIYACLSCNQFVTYYLCCYPTGRNIAHHVCCITAGFFLGNLLFYLILIYAEGFCPSIHIKPHTFKKCIPAERVCLCYVSRSSLSQCRVWYRVWLCKTNNQTYDFSLASQTLYRPLRCSGLYAVPAWQLVKMYPARLPTTIAKLLPLATVSTNRLIKSCFIKNS